MKITCSCCKKEQPLNKKHFHVINALKTWVDNAWWSWGNAIHFRIDRYEDNVDRCAFFYEINIGWYNMYDQDDDWEAFEYYEKQSCL